VRAARWKEKQGEALNNEPVQGSASQLESARGVWLVYSTKLTPSQDDRGSRVISGIGVEATQSPRGLRWFTTKSSGSLVEPQSQDRWLDGWRWDPGTSRYFEAEVTRQDRKACIEAK
jgi:signal transduction histidine kinase